ncbi:MAG: DNA-directed RNA polymerase subunit alpha C-terminal domain-containing protein [Candidatus Binataceae bacterium]
MNEIFRRPVANLPLSVRASQGLRYADIQHVGELVQCTERELLEIRNFGRKCLNEVKTVLAQMGLSLGMKPNDSN